ncbi:MAG: PfkB family carbohydrate kinase [Arenicellales bacterium]|nr:PfkB family carbohydrate kinase [Arenicellales bacterium]
MGAVGEDFPRKYINLYRRHGLCLEGLDQLPGQTFHWSGEYEVNMNNRRTLDTVLGVIENYSPTLPAAYTRLPYVLLANIAPDLQGHVLDQMKRPKFIVADTMDLWLNIARPAVLKLLKRIDCLVLNDSEAAQLVEEDNVVAALPRIHKLGPKYVIVKKGEHGAILSGPKGLFVAPAYPLKKVVDPTGAGDSFVGGLMGYLASQKGSLDKNLRAAIIHGTVTASYCCEDFGLKKTTKVKKTDISKRVRELTKMVSW